MADSTSTSYCVLESGCYSSYTWHVFMQVPSDIDFDAAYEEAHDAARVKVREEDGTDEYLSRGDVQEQYVKALERRGGTVLNVTSIHLGDYEPKTPDEMRADKR